MKLEFSPHITKNTQILNFMKLCPVGAEFQADKLMDRQTWSWQSLFAILQMRLKNGWKWNNSTTRNQNINHKANVTPYEGKE